MIKKLKAHALPLVALLLALLCGICLLSYNKLANSLESQKQAERWQGESQQRFKQLSCFMSVDEKLTMEQVFEFRKAMMEKFHEAALDIDTESQLFADCWSSFGKANVSSQQGKGQVSVTAVGGNYFDFHPIRLLSGNYIRQDDLMKDRVLLDEDTAWLLFGGTELQGMEFKINGVPFVVAGVIEREQDFASQQAYTSGMGIYMSYEAYESLGSASQIPTGLTPDDTSEARQQALGINCYEVVMAEPVDGFALGVAQEKFPIGGGLIVDNSGRFEYDSIIKMLRQFGQRSMQTQGVIFPYWENAARCIEDWCFALLMAAMLLAVLPGILVIIAIVKYYRRGKAKLSENIIPQTSEKLQEAIRVRQRRAWEKKNLK